MLESERERERERKGTLSNSNLRMLDVVSVEQLVDTRSVQRVYRAVRVKMSNKHYCVCVLLVSNLSPGLSLPISHRR
jgi:hypothetical protein